MKSKILDAQEKIVEIERRLFAELRSADRGRGQTHTANRAGAGGSGRSRLPGAHCGAAKLLPPDTSMS